MHKQKNQQPLYRYPFIYILLMLFSAVLAADEVGSENINDVDLFAQAVAFSQQERWLEAEPIYRELISRNKEWPEPANNLAVLLLKTNRINEAKKFLELAVISSPSYRVAQKNRSDLYNYLATLAYDKALGAGQVIAAPTLQLIDEIYQPVKIIEVEKIVIQEVIAEAVPSKDEVANLTAGISPDTQISSSEKIKQQLVAWSQAWSQGDFEFYIQMYSKDFLPSDARKSYTEWRNIRRARLKFTQGVNIKIENLRVFSESQGDYALVEFIQYYHSKSYSDKVLKQMYMRLQPEGWRILSERTIKIY